MARGGGGEAPQAGHPGANLGADGLFFSPAGGGGGSGSCRSSRGGRRAREEPGTPGSVCSYGRTPGGSRGTPYTCASAAIKYGRRDELRRLIETDAIDPATATSDEGTTLVMVAAQNNAGRGILRMLLQVP